MSTRRRSTTTEQIIAFVTASTLMVLIACGGAASQPAEGPGTSYPCGVWGVACSNGACCPWGHICGVEGDPWRRCEVGYCCYQGDPMYGSSADASISTPPAPPPLQQRKPR